MSNQTFSIWDGSVASSFGGGTGTEANPYLINSAAQLAYLAEVFNDPDVKNNTYYGKYYKLTSNIDLDKREWEPIGDRNKFPRPDYNYIAIHFDGGTHIVRGLYIDRPEENDQGLFGGVYKPSSFKNITIEDAYVSGKQYVGGLIGEFCPSFYDGIENCHFSGEIHGKSWSGGIIGYGYGGYLKDCTNAGTITIANSFGGGIASSFYGENCEVTNCINTGTITGSGGVGGIVGRGIVGDDSKTLFKYCQNSGNIINGAGIAYNGRFKYCQNSGDIINGVGISQYGSFEYCSNSGNISGAGGITDKCSGGYIKNCHNSGTITKEGDNIGGLTGTATNATIELCTNTGTVNGTGWKTGGICGYSINSTIEYCTNEGVVNSSKLRVGGIVGEGNHVIQCYNTGAVKGLNYSAGICGYSEAEDSLIAGCVNDGFIEASWYGAGIAGSFKGTIQNCINMAPIQTYSSAGGIVCKGGIAVKNCYNTGSITGSSFLGGIISETLVEGFLLEKNYNSGKIGSTNLSGGILGFLQHDGGQIIDCHYHTGSAQKGIGNRMSGLSIEATGYVESVVSADDPKTVPAMLTQSIVANTVLATLSSFWSKKKLQHLTQISKLVSISKSLGVGQDENEEPLNEIAGDDMYIVTEHTPVREAADPNSNIIAMSFKKDIVKVLPQTRSVQGDYYRIEMEDNRVGLLPSSSLVRINTTGVGNTPYTVTKTKALVYSVPSRWCLDFVEELNFGDIVWSVPNAKNNEDTAVEGEVSWIRVYVNTTTTGWVQKSMLKEGLENIEYEIYTTTCDTDVMDSRFRFVGELSVGTEVKVVKPIKPETLNDDMPYLKVIYGSGLYWVCELDLEKSPEGSGEELSTDLFIQTTVWDYFIEKGFTKVQVAGIMGNAMQESTWNPLCRDSGSQFWGLFQIGKVFALELEKEYAASGLNLNLYGYNISTHQGIGAEKNIPRADLKKILEVQLDYVYGCKPTSKDWISQLHKASTVNEAAEIFLVLFEGATTSNQISGNKILYYSDYIGKYYQEADKRRDHAATYYDIFTN